eukprot:3401908-Rhodomonas_salina.1
MHVRAALAPRDVDGVVAGRAFAGAVEVRAPRVVRLVPARQNKRVSIPVRKHGVRACGHASLAGVENGRVVWNAGALRTANTVVRSLHVVVELRPSSQRRGVRGGHASLAGVENGRVFRDAGALRAANTVVRSLHVVVELRTSSQRRSVRSGVAAS